MFDKKTVNKIIITFSLDCVQKKAIIESQSNNNIHQLLFDYLNKLFQFF